MISAASIAEMNVKVERLHRCAACEIGLEHFGREPKELLERFDDRRPHHPAAALAVDEAELEAGGVAGQEREGHACETSAGSPGGCATIAVTLLRSGECYARRRT